MRKTYLEIVLEHIGISQAQLARLLGWSPQRVGYLCSPECKSFPFEELWFLKETLNLSDGEQVQICNEYFRQYRGNGKVPDVPG